MNIFIFKQLLLDLDLTLSLPGLGLDLALLLHLLVLDLAFALHLESLHPALTCLHLLALAHTTVVVSLVLLVLLLFEKLLNQHVLFLLLIKPLLSVFLVDSQLSSTSLTLLASEVTLLLSLLDLVHGRGEGEILNLTRWDTLLLLLSLDGVIHIDILLNTKLLEILFKFFETAMHLLSRLI